MRRALAIPAAAGLLWGLASLTPASAATFNYTATLSGAAEVPGPGDPDAGGSATVTINDVSNEVCLAADVSNVGMVTGQHLHAGGVGVAGGVVVNFSGGLNSCAMVEASVITNLLTNPTGFYLNVHTDEFPNGAIRGQLAGQPGITTTTTSTTTTTVAGGGTTTTTAAGGTTTTTRAGATTTATASAPQVAGATAQRAPAVASRPAFTG